MWCRLGLARNANFVIGGCTWDNLWSDSATGESGGVCYRGLSCENCKSYEWTTSLWGYPS